MAGALNFEKGVHQLHFCTSNGVAFWRTHGVNFSTHSQGHVLLSTC